jgi:hypothetical protein
MQSYAQIWFTGAATVNLNGNGTLSDSCLIVPYNAVPANLIWRMASGKTWTAHDGFIFGGAFVAPGGTFTVNDACYMGGSIFAKQITMHDLCQFYSDEDLVQQSTPVAMAR